MREGIASLLRRAGVEVVAEAGDADELLQQVDEHAPDAAIVDVRMPPTHTDEGLRAAHEIRARHPRTGIVILSQTVEAGTALHLLAERPEGLGYLLKDRVTDVDDFARTLRRVAARRLRARPAGRHAAAGEPGRPRAAGHAQPARARRARARRRGPLEPGRRGPPRRHRARRAEARDVDLRQARPRSRARTTTAASWPSWRICDRIAVACAFRHPATPGDPLSADRPGWDLRLDHEIQERPRCSQSFHSRFAPPSAVVSARSLVRRYGSGDTAVDALRGVSVDIAEGRLTAVMGPSGSGKSTLMHILAGLDKPTSGEVTVAGVDIAGLDDNALTKLRRDHIGFIFQFFNLLPMLTAAENIALPLKLAGVKPDQAWLDEVVAAVGLSERLKHRPSELSGGQQQRVAVARALVGRPTVMFADEPTGNLDSRTSGEILTLLRDAVDTLGQTTVMVTHDAHAAAIADRVLFLADGDIVRDLGPSTAHEILETLEEVSGR